ncbi:hypothetical protein PO909_016887, partial [Leuciscus waleckii]
MSYADYELCSRGLHCGQAVCPLVCLQFRVTGVLGTLSDEALCERASASSHTSLSGHCVGRPKMVTNQG